MATKNATAEELNKKLQEFNEMSEYYKLAYVDPKELVPLAKNARYMSKSQMGQLVNNISEDKFLSQLPFCMKREDGSMLILSGNHRVKAAIKSGLEHIMVQYIDEVEKEKWLAIQLSHNAITGQDDAAILKELYDMISTLDGKEYSGINEQDLKEFEELPIKSISEDSITLHEMGFVFSDLNLKKLDETILLLNQLSEKEDKEKMFMGLSFHKFIEVMSDIKDRSGIKNHTVAFIKMLNICEEWVEQQEGEEVKELKGK